MFEVSPRDEGSAYQKVRKTRRAACIYVRVLRRIGTCDPNIWVLQNLCNKFHYKARFVMIFDTASNSLRYIFTLTEACILPLCDLRACMHQVY